MIDEDSIEVYLTSPSDLAAFRKTQLNDIPAIQKGTEEYDSHHFEGSPPSSSNPRENSLNDEYLISPQPKKNEGTHIQSGIPQPRPKKPVIQDIYDENHYCLPRSSEYGFQDVLTVETIGEKKDDDVSSEKRKNYSCTKNKIIICLIVCILALGAAGGVVAFFRLGNQGKSNLSG